MAKPKLKTAKELGITKRQHKNLAKLITFVLHKVEPPKFNIKSFYDDKKSHPNFGGRAIGKPKYECGTTACFCGYGPLAGVESCNKTETWAEYASRAFGAGCFGAYRNERIWHMLFSASHKNDKMAAVKRGAWLLQHGLPSGDFVLEAWEAPATFRPRYAAIRKASV